MPLAHLSKLTIFHSSRNVPGSASFSLPPCDVIYSFLFPSYVFIMDVSSRIEALLGSGFISGRCRVHLASWKRSSCSHLLVCSTVVQGVLQLPTTILVSYNPKSVLLEITGKQRKSAVGSLPLIFSFFFVYNHQSANAFSELPSRTYPSTPFWIFVKLSSSIPK